MKWILSRRVRTIGAEIGSTAVQADGRHHMSDAVTSAAAFVGISIALWGGRGWQSADDWVHILASGVIAFNGVNMLRPALYDLMDRCRVGRCRTRRARSRASMCPRNREAGRSKSGLGYRVTIHVQIDPSSRCATRT